jgi:SNF2 family DNA or RNA helicase
MIRERFPAIVTVDGETTPRQRVEIIDRFNADRIPLLVANAASFGHGINLQKGASQTVIWFANTWSYESFAQFNARLIRSGQGKRVSIITLKSDIGLDDALLAVIAAKAGGEAALLQAFKQRSQL